MSEDFFTGTGEGAERGIAPRIIFDMPASKYHQDPDGVIRLSNSIAGLLLDESPQHAWRSHPLLGRAARNEDEGDGRTRAFDFGTIVHQMLLGGDTGIDAIQARYSDDDKDKRRRGQLVTDYKTKAAQEERDRIISAGRIPLLEKETGKIDRACAAIRERLADLDLSLKGKSEVTVLWSSRGVACKGRIDHLLELENETIIIDLKTTENANPRKLERHITDYNYHMQAAAYIEAIETIYPERAGRVRFVDLFVEKSWPYYTVPVEISGPMLELGERKWSRAVQRWSDCLEEGHWPDYAGGGILRLEPRQYVVAEEEMRSAEAS